MDSNSNYIILKEGDVIQKGDEWYWEEMDEWMKCDQSVGKTVATDMKQLGFTVRRKKEQPCTQA